MRVGVGVSLAAHLAILAAGLIAFPDARPFQVDDIQALPVDLVALADTTDLRIGDRKAEPKPEETPQPKAVAKADQPNRKAPEKPASKPVEAAREPAPKPIRDVTEQPKPEQPKAVVVAEAPQPPAPAPVPKTAPPKQKQPMAASKPAEPAPELAKAPAQLPKPPAPAPSRPSEPKTVAALPKPVEPIRAPEPAAAEPAENTSDVADETAPEAPATPSAPRSRPKPPPQLAAAQPAPQPAQVKPTQQPAQDKPTPQPAAKDPEPKFNTEDIAALLNKQEPAGGGDPVPVSQPQTFGAAEGRANAAMVQSQLAALQARLYQCWNPPIGVRQAGNLRVEVLITLGQDGSLSAAPQVVSAGYDALSQIAAESAVRAVVQCAPYGDVLTADTYPAWRDGITFNFDPRDMFGG